MSTPFHRRHPVVTTFIISFLLLAGVAALLTGVGIIPLGLGLAAVITSPVWLTVAHAALIGAIAGFGSIFTSMIAKINSLRAERDTDQDLNQRSTATLQERVTSLERDLDTRTRRANTLDSDVARERTARRDAEHELHRVNAKRSQLALTNEALLKRAERAENRAAKLENEVAELEDEVAELEGQAPQTPASGGKSSSESSSSESSSSESSSSESSSSELSSSESSSHEQPKQHETQPGENVSESDRREVKAYVDNVLAKKHGLQSRDSYVDRVLANRFKHEKDLEKSPWVEELDSAPEEGLDCPRASRRYMDAAYPFEIVSSDANWDEAKAQEVYDAVVRYYEHIIRSLDIELHRNGTYSKENVDVFKVVLDGLQQAYDSTGYVAYSLAVAYAAETSAQTVRCDEDILTEARNSLEDNKNDFLNIAAQVAEEKLNEAQLDLGAIDEEGDQAATISERAEDDTRAASFAQSPHSMWGTDASSSVRDNDNLIPDDAPQSVETLLGVIPDDASQSVETLLGVIPDDVAFQSIETLLGVIADDASQSDDEEECAYAYA